MELEPNPKPVTNVSKADYVDALNEYYGYKHKYDKKFEEDKNAVKNADTLTLQQKRAKIMRIKRNRKCVSCGQIGGTHFTNEDGVLRAQCGNRSQPCSIRIEIVKGKFMCLEELANASLRTADLLKDQIIKTNWICCLITPLKRKRCVSLNRIARRWTKRWNSTAGSGKSIWTWCGMRNAAKKWMR